jgi:CBS domain-containing protein
MKDIFVKEIMSTKLITLSPYDTLLTAKKYFDKEKIHHIPIIYEEKLIGILSNTDLERSKHGKTLFIDPNRDKHNDTILEGTLISMVMTEIVETVTVSDTIFNVYKIFKEHQFRSLPVLENGDLVGIVTPMDFLDFFFNKNEK